MALEETVMHLIAAARACADCYRVGSDNLPQEPSIGRWNPGQCAQLKPKCALQGWGSWELRTSGIRGFRNRHSLDLDYGRVIVERRGLARVHLVTSKHQTGRFTRLY